MEVNKRVSTIRKTLGYTLEEFGNRLGVTKTAISRLENGKTNLTNQMSTAICREYNISEAWLKDGIGEMFIELPENDIIKRATILLGEKDPLFESFVVSYSKLNQNNRKVLVDFGLEFLNELKNRTEEKEG